LFHYFKELFDVFILFVVHKVIGHRVSNDSAVHFSLDFELSSVWIIPVGGLDVVRSNRLDLLLLNEDRVTVFARTDVFVSQLNNPIKDVFFVSLNQRNVFVHKELRLFHREELALLQLCVLLPLHLLELVLFAKLGEINFEVVIRGVNDLVVLVNGCLECFASDPEPNSSEANIQALS